jgi:hypothetical protein
MAKEALTLVEVSKHNTKDTAGSSSPARYVRSRHARLLLLFLPDLVPVCW